MVCRQPDCRSASSALQVDVVRSKSWRNLEQGTGESKTPKPDDADKSKKGPRVPFNFMTAGMPCCGENKPRPRSTPKVPCLRGVWRSTP
jgi:hypothetical protein